MRSTRRRRASFDQNHLAYEIFQSFQDEVGDACEFFTASSEEEPPPFTFVVQRPWSNVAASRGHDPCIPRDYDESYCNTTTFADQLDDITVDLTPIGFGPMTTKGIEVALGESKTFEIGFYSDGPTDPWTVSAVVAPTLPFADMNGNAPENGDIDVTIDHPTAGTATRRA